MRPLLLTVLSIVALLGCGGSTEPPAPVPVVPSVATVTIVAPTGSLDVGGTLALATIIRDPTGAQLSGRTLSWATSNATIATVSGEGVVAGVAAGNVIISATVEGKTGSTQVTVAAPAVATVSVAPPSGGVVAGQAYTLSALVSDRLGGTLLGRRVTWTSSATIVATVDSNGRLTALSPGSTTITALCEGISASTSIVVTPPAGSAAPTIASISPSTLAPGATMTITGDHFVTSGVNALFVAGVPIAVMAASATQLTATLPVAGLPCASLQSAPVTIATIGGTVSTGHPLAVAVPRPLAVGESVILAAANGALACNELPVGGNYLVSVFNTSSSATTTARFEFRGSSGGATSARVPSPGQTPAEAVASRRAVSPSPRASEQEAEHLGRLEEDRALFQRLGAPTRGRGASLSRSGVPRVPVTVGTTTTLNYHYNSCSATGFTTLTARVVYVGPKVIVVEDVAGPLAGAIDADLIALATEFETRSYPLLLNFGDPLAYDAHTDANGKLIVLFTPKVNNQSQNLLGFVAGCDLYAPAQDPTVAASNEMEIFYARTVTDTSPTSTSLSGLAQWKRQMPATMIHEAKHIVSYAERLARGGTLFEQIWLEEATAQAASELYGRAIHGNSWRGDALYAPTLSCEARPTTPSCDGGVIAMGNHFAFLSDYLQNFENKSILSGTDDNDIYGSAWLFVRWAADSYGGTDEGAFFRGLVQTGTRSGTTNMEAVSGKPFAQLLAEFTLMLAGDNLPNVSAPYVEPSWNLPDVFAGYAELGTHPSAPLAMRESSGGAFSVSGRNLKGGGAVLLKLGAVSPGATQLLDMRATVNAPLSTGSPLGMAILRVQ
ncbi:MAG TPA: Ig-like domain-containing protein [Gemmatimonadaceae bacterium]|nr:Ig-like domain-containing protein [Gemmatimonadaceae bacterium]